VRDGAGELTVVVAGASSRDLSLRTTWIVRRTVSVRTSGVAVGAT
jgi:hypothetical protein